MKARAPPLDLQKRTAWFALIAEHLPVLYRFVRHEIARYEAEGELLPGQLSAEAAVDAMLLRAQREFVSNPTGKNSRGWLIRRAREQLAADVRQLKATRDRAASLEIDTSEFPNPVAIPLEGGNDAVFYEPEELRPEDLFADIDLPASPEQEAEAKELQSCVDAALAEMPREWRQTLQLHYGDDFSTAELAEALGRPEVETRRMLDEARGVVRRKLHEAGCRFKAEGNRPGDTDGKPV